MIKLTIINQKGGVGKSTTALAISQYYTAKGKRVLLVDLDAQGNSTYSTAGEVQKHGVLGVLLNPKTIKEEIFHQPQGAEQPDILPSTSQLANADTLLLNEVSKEYRLKIALEAVEGNYDLCVIDTPPALSVLTINALVASNYCLVPAIADIYSIQGISQLNETIKVVKQYCNASLEVLGVVLNKYKQAQILSKGVAGELEELAKALGTKLLKARIRESVAINESALKRVNMFAYKPNCNACKDYEELIKEIGVLKSE